MKIRRLAVANSSIRSMLFDLFVAKSKSKRYVLANIPNKSENTTIENCSTFTGRVVTDAFGLVAKNDPSASRMTRLVSRLGSLDSKRNILLNATDMAKVPTMDEMNM